MGVVHGDELPFVFGFPFSALGLSAIDYSSREKLLSRKVMTYWTNFAKFGDPNTNDAGSPNGRLLPLSPWPQYDSKSKNVLAISVESAERGPLEADSIITDFKRRDCTV